MSLLAGGLSVRVLDSISTQRHRDTETQRHRDTETQSNGDTEIQTYRDTDIRTYRHTDIRTYGHTDICARDAHARGAPDAREKPGGRHSCTIPTSVTHVYMHFDTAILVRAHACMHACMHACVYALHTLYLLILYYYNILYLLINTILHFIIVCYTYAHAGGRHCAWAKVAVVRHLLGASLRRISELMMLEAMHYYM